jgi:hypothetical protein
MDEKGKVAFPDLENQITKREVNLLLQKFNQKSKLL